MERLRRRAARDRQCGLPLFLVAVFVGEEPGRVGGHDSLYKARERMLSEYETTDKEMGAGGQMRRVDNLVIFNDYFINGLLQRSLFDVDWNKVRSIKLVPTFMRKR